MKYDSTMHIDIINYSGKANSSDIEEIFRQAVNDFPTLSNELDTLLVFVFSSKQIQERTDMNEIRFHASRYGLRLKSEPGWDLMYSWWGKNIELIEVNIDKFMNATDTSRRFIARHELGHRYLHGPEAHVALNEKLMGSKSANIVNKEIDRILTLWKEYKVNSLMMRLFPELTIQYMFENSIGFSSSKDKEILNRYSRPFEKFLAALRLMIIGETQLAILSEAHPSLKEERWKSIEKLHSDRIASLKVLASEIRPELKELRIWFAEECLEDPKLLTKRILELSLPSTRRRELS